MFGADKGTVAASDCRMNGKKLSIGIVQARFNAGITDALAAAIARDDKASVGRANGVGPKLALRIVTELKGKPISDGMVAGAHTPA